MTLINVIGYLSITVMTGHEPQQSSTDGNKATVTRRCFIWARDVNLRVCFLSISILIKLYTS